MWKEPRATYHGKHYHIDEALCSPKPMQKPLPIWIGGSKPRVMRAAARYASAFNFNLGTSAQTSTLKAAMSEMDEHCRAVKREPSTLLRSSFLMSTVGSTSARSDALLKEFAAQQGTSPAKVLEQRPGLLRETPERALSRLREYAALGIAHANIMFQPYGSEREQIAALAGIAPKLA
jgi:alkanesulfonate monooxygenase SsuD/methylene tetrahydromethanopterin reductase-like flavin-dependent oxidoreductase (luciferase family)